MVLKLLEGGFNTYGQSMPALAFEFSQVPNFSTEF